MDSIQNAPEEDESLIYLAGGGIAAMLLGMALIPLRDFTSASNFAFPFMALRIAVAEFGGRRAAVVTERLLAASGQDCDRAMPQQVLRAGTLLPDDVTERILTREGLPFPVQGARLRIVSGGRQVGWLVQWGNGGSADAAARHALSDVARLLGVWLARGGIASSHR
jgi:hypothetical protein